MACPTEVNVSTIAKSFAWFEKIGWTKKGAHRFTSARHSWQSSPSHLNAGEVVCRRGFLRPGFYILNPYPPANHFPEGRHS
jgi:hypothetical protein